jgi:hypothetical protein
VCSSATNFNWDSYWILEVMEIHSGMVFGFFFFYESRGLRGLIASILAYMILRGKDQSEFDRYPILSLVKDLMPRFSIFRFLFSFRTTDETSSFWILLRFLWWKFSDLAPLAFVVTLKAEKELNIEIFGLVTRRSWDIFWVLFWETMGVETILE